MEAGSRAVAHRYQRVTSPHPHRAGRAKRGELHGLLSYDNQAGARARFVWPAVLGMGMEQRIAAARPAPSAEAPAWHALGSHAAAGSDKVLKNADSYLLYCEEFF